MYGTRMATLDAVAACVAAAAAPARRRRQRQQLLCLRWWCFIGAVILAIAVSQLPVCSVEALAFTHGTLQRPSLLRLPDYHFTTKASFRNKADSPLLVGTAAAQPSRLQSFLWSSLNSDDESNANSATSTASESSIPPMAFAAGYSSAANLVVAIQEAVGMAVASLPRGIDAVDLCVITVSSLYDGKQQNAVGLDNGNLVGASSSSSPATITVPAVLAAAQWHGVATVRHVIGCSSAGAISSRSATLVDSSSASSTATTSTTTSSSRTVELEAVPAVSVTLAVLPDCTLHTFHVASADLPDQDGTTSAAAWKRAVGVSNVGLSSLSSLSSSSLLSSGETDTDSESATTLSLSPPLFWLCPSPAFATSLDTLMQGLQQHFAGCTIMGGIASTVSSLSRAKVYRWSSSRYGSSSSSNMADVAFADGCVGVAISGDLACLGLTALGAKPVGGIYQILQGSDTTIQTIVLDERATDALNDETVEDENDDDEEEEEEEEPNDEALSPAERKAALAQVYAKARIPKPVLAEANFLMRTLSDADQAFMRRQLLVGLDAGGSVGRTASELARLAAGLGHRFTVYPVVSAGMKDGSVTLALGSVSIAPGTRLRFFVRDSDFAVREVEALWTGYKKRVLNEQFQASSDTTSKPSFKPACCFLVPTLDRGSKFFQGKQQCFESSTAARMLPGVQCVSGFFANGIIAVSGGAPDEPSYGIQGSASAYFLLGSKSGRPVYSAAAEAYEARQFAAESSRVDDTTATTLASTSTPTSTEKAPQYANGELMLKRREVHSGRALTVSAVEWSVAEKAAKPSSALEGFMWDKETEVDRFRERVPLSDLASQCRALSTDANARPVRDWIGPVLTAAAQGRFVIVPECKRNDPAHGALRRRYDVTKLVRDFTAAGAPALSVNCDAVLFGGSLDHISEAKNAAASLAITEPTTLSLNTDALTIPVLASDLILYPYQLYKLRLAGADAINLVVGALAASKDVFYLAKISASLSLQTLVTVTTTVQIERVTEALPPGSLQGVIVSNRILEDFSMDESGEQALALLASDALQALQAKHGHDILVLAEGRVGLIERANEHGQMTTAQYLKELQNAGAVGAIVGTGLASSANGESDTFRLLQEQANAIPR
jgi:indole-3-glycerol phosphate synthase